MNKHELADRLPLLVAALLAGRHKYFARSLESPTLTTLASQLQPRGEMPTTPGIHELVIDSARGPLDPAYAVVHWHAPEAPTLIFHHGNNERPFDTRARAKNSFHRLFPRPETAPCNLIVVRAPFHASSLREYNRQIGDLARFAEMIASAAAVTEALITVLRSQVFGPIMVAGISLGGWVTNLHHAVFGTADGAVPIFAGAALAETFLTSAYRRLTAPAALADPERLRATLNFEQLYQQAPQVHVYPLLARYDQYIDLDRQSRSYGGIDVSVIEAGHVTGTLDAERLRGHLLGAIARLG